jgi:putative ABC transport system permease protein
MRGRTSNLSTRPGRQLRRPVTGGMSMGALWRDLRYAVRMLRQRPAFAAVASLTLALGIGATTIIFSAIDGILIEPFPYRDAARLTTFYVHDVSRPNQTGRSGFTMPEFMDYREQNHAFEDLMGTSNLDVLYTNEGETQLFPGCWVTPNMFNFLGVKPLVGRQPTEDDAKPGATPVFVLSDRGWGQHFNRDPAVVGKSFLLNGVSRTLVAVMPPRYLPANCDIWMPIAFSRTDVMDASGVRMFFNTRGRLKRGVTLEAAAADLGPIATRLSTVYTRDYPKQFSVLTRTFTDNVVGNFKGMLYALVAAVTLLLLIACSNVANLLLARATARGREIAIRAALGAGKGRIVSQLVVESFVLSIAGCALGCLLAWVGLKAVVAMIPPGAISPTSVIAFSPVALAFAVAISLVTTLLCGMAPALHAVRGELARRLVSSAKGAGAGVAHGRLRAGLVVFEVALSILLLVGAGLMMRTLFALERVDLGFNPQNVFSARLPLPSGRYDTADQKRVFFRQVLDRVAALPGVVSATTTSTLPPYGGIRGEVTIPGKTHTERWEAVFQLCSEGYFPTLGLRLLRGRSLSLDDVEGARHVAVVSELLARTFFKDEDPIGRTIKFNVLDQLPQSPHDAYFEIIGVSSDAKNQGLQDPPLPEAFVPYAITGFFNRGLLIRTAIDPNRFVSSVRRTIFAVDANVALAPPTGSLEEFLKQNSYAGPEFGLTTLGAFAAVGLVLVVIGVFSVMAYAVSLRTQEIGIRMALGAQRGDIVSMLLRSGLLLVGAGTAIGLMASAALTRLIANQIWGVSPTDPSTLFAVASLVVIVGLLACALPARTATRVDPLIVLRYE